MILIRLSGYIAGCVFVFGLPGRVGLRQPMGQPNPWPCLVGLPVHSQWSRFLQYASVCRSHAFGRCFLFADFFSEVFSLSLFQFLSKNLVSILREPHSLNWCKFFIRALSSLFNSTLHYRYFVTVLKILIVCPMQCNALDIIYKKSELMLMRRATASV